MNPLTRLWIGAALVAVLAMAFATDFYGNARAAAAQPDPYRVADQLQRFSSVVAAVPASETLGYVSDQGLETAQGQAMYFGAQYAFAPHLLTPDWQQHSVRYVLANFSNPQGMAAFNSSGLKVVRDFGSGVLLYERERQ